jgi:glucosamine-6-phosphate deaminase
MHKAVKVVIADSQQSAARFVVKQLAESLSMARRPRLGTATGATMRPIYTELVSQVQEGLICLAEVEAFQLDEYLGVPPWDERSYRAYLTKYFSCTDLPLTRLHTLNGLTDDPEATCTRWDERYTASPITLQLFGIGPTGSPHLAFAMPRSRDSRELLNIGTSVVELDQETKNANSKFFADGCVPTRALSWGFALLDYIEHSVLVAFGSGKSRSCKEALLGPIDDRCPASYLRMAKGHVTFVMDYAAAAEFICTIHAHDLPEELDVRFLHQDELLDRRLEVSRIEPEMARDFFR